jgi:RHS repeat-associated protein
VTRVINYNWRGQGLSSVLPDGSGADFTTGSTAAEVDWPAATQAQTYFTPAPDYNATTTPKKWLGTFVQNGMGTTGMLYRRNRYFDTKSGRFTQEDPTGIATGLNAYGFAEGDPVNYSDPFGLCGQNQVDIGFGICYNSLAALGMAIGGVFQTARFGLDALRIAARAHASAATVSTAAGSARIMLETGKQGKHIIGHNNFIPGRSVFSHPNPQRLLDKFAGSGTRMSGVAGGPGRELVDFGQVIGQVMVNGTLTDTTMGIIHYSKKGAHIVPRIP